MNFNAPQKSPTQASPHIFGEPHSVYNKRAGAEALPHKKQRKPTNKRIAVWTSSLLALILIVFAVRAVYHHIVYAGIDMSRYQAVYLTNDNVYFGKTHIQVNGDIFLTDVFRVQTASKTGSSDNSSSTNADSTSGEIRLIKPGKELHAPDDTMLIRRGSVLFIENLKTDGNVTQAILDYHKQNTSN